MGRPVDLAPEPTAGQTNELARLRRLLLESIPLDSPAYRDHQARLLKAGADPVARVRVYEHTVRKLTLTKGS